MTYNKVEDIPADVMREAKILGFSDFQIARFVLNPTGNSSVIVSLQKNWDWNVKKIRLRFQTMITSLLFLMQ